MAFTYLKVKSAKCLCLLPVVLVLALWSWSCKQRSWSWSYYFGLRLKNLVLFTSLQCSIVTVGLSCTISDIKAVFAAFSHPRVCNGPSDGVRRGIL